LEDPPKFTQIGIFGLKTNHLATLLDNENRTINYFSPTLARRILDDKMIS
jgi:hypothetical protein